MCTFAPDNHFWVVKEFLAEPSGKAEREKLKKLRDEESEDV